MNSGHKSSVSISISMPENEGRQRSPSKGFLDIFRRRRKSGSNLMITNILVNESAVEFPASLKNKSNKARQRSNSVQVGESSPMSVPSANSVEPLRIAIAKREFVNRMSLSPQDHVTPMGDLLSRSLGHGDSLFPTNKKVGPNEFMELYRNRRFSLDSESSNSLSKIRQKKKGEAHTPESPLAREKPPLMKHPLDSIETKPDFSSRFPKSSDHMALPVGTKPRRLSVFSPPTDRSEEGRFKQLGLPSRHRRFSEPQGPKLEVLRKLSGAHSKIFEPERISEAMSNFPKFTSRSSIPKNSLPTANLGNCLGRHIPLEPAHYVVWKEGKKIEKILKLPCTEEECLGPIEDLGSGESHVFIKFLKSHRCYELMPASAKLVILDKELKVTYAFDALTYNGIRSAPIWDPEACEYIGMLTVTDFIQILKQNHQSKEELNKVCSQKISEWRELLDDDLKPMVTIDSDTSLFESVLRLHKNGIHRLLVTDEHTNEALYILTYRRIVHFVWYFFQVFHLSVPEFMKKSVKELDIGTYSDLASIQKTTPLIDALNLLTERRLSVLPVLDAEGCVVNIYGRFDIMNLVNNDSYRDLERTVEQELKTKRSGFEGLYICKSSDSLETVIDRLVRADVHRLVVLDDKRQLEGVVSLSDVVHFMILQHDSEDVQSDDMEDEMNFD